jgi:hypothetical protein
MRAHPEYKELVEEQKQETVALDQPKRVGRPPKNFKEE